VHYAPRASGGQRVFAAPRYEASLLSPLLSMYDCLGISVTSSHNLITMKKTLARLFRWNP
jgi:hypothetical protein